MCLDFRTPKIINFPFETNGKLIILVVLVLKLIRVLSLHQDCYGHGKKVLDIFP